MDFVAWFTQKYPYLYQFREMLLYGALMTLGLTTVAVAGGSVVGLFGALARLLRFEQGGWFLRCLAAAVRGTATLYVTLFRGTPLLVQIFIWHFVLMPLFVHPQNGWILNGDAAQAFRRDYGAITAGVLALTANSGAYITEIFRAGIQSIDRGQMEAARSLGLSYWQAMRFIILPQALRRMLPPLANEFITLLKDSSLLSAIAVAELTYVQKTISGRYSVYDVPLYTVALIYLAMTILLSWLFATLDKRLNKTQHH